MLITFTIIIYIRIIIKNAKTIRERMAFIINIQVICRFTVSVHCFKLSFLLSYYDRIIFVADISIL